MLTELVSKWLRAVPRHRFHVRELRDAGQLASVQSLWESLYRQTAGASFFQSWDWFETYWKHFGGEQQLRILVVADASGQPIGLVPLALASVPSRIGHVRRLGFPLDNWGTQYGPLGPSPADSLSAAFAHLARQRQEWDVIDLRWVPVDHCSDYVQAWRFSGLPFQQQLWSRTDQIDLSAGWCEYWNQRSSKWRNNQRRSEKSLARLGTVRFEHYRPAPGSSELRHDLFDACTRVAAASWQGACTSGNTLNHTNVQPFLRELHDLAVQRGCLYLSLLWVDERPAAFTYNYVQDGVVSGLRMGYDLQFQAAGAGAVLMRETIRECCLRGDQIFDLGESPAPYKRHVANRFLETFRFCHYSPSSPIAQAIRFKGWMTQSAAE